MYVKENFIGLRVWTVELEKQKIDNGTVGRLVSTIMVNRMVLATIQYHTRNPFLNSLFGANSRCRHRLRRLDDELNVKIAGSV